MDVLSARVDDPAEKGIFGMSPKDVSVDRWSDITTSCKDGCSDRLMNYPEQIPGAT